MNGAASAAPHHQQQQPSTSAQQSYQTGTLGSLTVAPTPFSSAPTFSQVTNGPSHQLAGRISRPSPVDHHHLVNGSSSLSELSAPSPSSEVSDISPAVRSKTGGKHPRDLLTERLKESVNAVSPFMTHAGHMTRRRSDDILVSTTHSAGYGGVVSGSSSPATPKTAPLHGALHADIYLTASTSRPPPTVATSSAPSNGRAPASGKNTSMRADDMLMFQSPNLYQALPAHPSTSSAVNYQQCNGSASSVTPSPYNNHEDRPQSTSSAGWGQHSDGSLHDLSDVANTHSSPFTQNEASTSQASTAPPAKKARTKNGDKPQGQQCSFADPDKPCRQRAILGYQFCIRHILNDPSAPYKSCAHKKKNKRKGDQEFFCSNPVRSDQELPYCSTHLILLGMKEPKRKNNDQSTSLQPPPTPQQQQPNFFDVQNHAQWPQQPTHQQSGSYFDPQQQRLINAQYSNVANASQSYATPSAFANGHAQSPSSTDQQFALLGSPAANSFAQPAAPQQNGYDWQQGQHQPQSMMGTFSPPAPQGTFVPTQSTPSASSRPESTLSSYNSSAPQPPNNGSNSLVSACPELASKLTQRPMPVSMPTTSAQIKIETPPTPQRQYQQVVFQPTTSTARILAQPPTAVVQQPTQIYANAVAPNASSAALVVRAAQPTQQQQVLHTYYTGGALGSQQLPFPYAPAGSAQNDGVVLCDTKEDGKRVIRLRQKRQRLKMVGRYRHIPAVNHMCKVLEDADFDRSDLFPLGLEASDSDTETEEDETGVASQLAEKCFTAKLLLLSDSVTTSTNWQQEERDAKIKLYLLKKTLRLQRYSLLREARTNAAVMPTARRYPNSVGRALIDKAERGRTQHSYKWTRLRRHMRLAHQSTYRRSPRVVYAHVPRRCSEPACTNRRLPYANHCSLHVPDNDEQHLFQQCRESRCTNSVIDFDGTSHRCTLHRRSTDIKPDMLNQDSLDSFFDNGNSKETSLLASANVRSKGRSIAKSNSGGVRRLIVSSDDEGSALQSPTDTGSPPKVMLSSNAADSSKHYHNNHDDVSLASVAKDLGFGDDSDLNDILTNMPEDINSIMTQELGKSSIDGGGMMLSYSAPSTSGLLRAPNDLVVSSLTTGLLHVDEQSTAMHDDEQHNWADIESFLQSEGYNPASSQASFAPAQNRLYAGPGDMPQQHHHLLGDLSQSNVVRAPPPPYNMVVSGSWSQQPT